MKLQPIDTPRGERWLLLDKDYAPVNEVNAYLGSLDAMNRSPQTIRTYAYALLIYCRYLEGRGLSVLDLGTSVSTAPVVLLSDFMSATQFPYAEAEGNIVSINSGRQAVSGGRINNIMSAVLGFYRFMARADMMPNMVDDLYTETLFNAKLNSFLSELTGSKRRLSSILTIRTRRKEPKYVTREGYCRIFDNCKTLRDKLFVAILFECGLRSGEACGIRLEDLNEVECGTLKIVPRDDNENGARVKYSAAGEVYLPDYVVRLLVEYLESSEGSLVRDYLFVVLRGPTAGRAMRTCNANRLFSRISADIGKRVHPHMLRHGFATEKLEAGWSEEEVSLYLRHAHVSSTRIYEHFTERMKEERLRPFLNATSPRGLE